MSASENLVTLRLMTEHDLPMLHRWLNRPHIVEWWGGEGERPTLGDVMEHYMPSLSPFSAVLPDRTFKLSSNGGLAWLAR